MLAEDAEASPRTHRLLFTPAKRTSLADAAAAVFSSPLIAAASDAQSSIKAMTVTPTSNLRHAFGGTTAGTTRADASSLVTPTSSKSKPSKALCEVDGCTRKGVSFGKCARHYNEELASARRPSKRAPKRSKVDIMMEFERKSEIPAVNRSRKTSMDHTEENKHDGEKQIEQQLVDNSTAAEARESVSALPKPKEIECDWRETIDATSGKPYYYHIRTNEVTWTKPSSLIAAEEVKAIVASTPSDYTGNYHAPTNASVPLDMARKKAKNSWGQGQWRGITQVNTKFKAAITVAGRTRHIGTFDSSEHAIRAYGYVKNILTNCGLDPMDKEGRDVVFDAAKIKAKEVAIMTGSGSDVAAAHNGNSAVQVPAQRPMKRSVDVVITPSGKFSANDKVKTNKTTKATKTTTTTSKRGKNAAGNATNFEGGRVVRKYTKKSPKWSNGWSRSAYEKGKIPSSAEEVKSNGAAKAKPPAKPTAQTKSLPQGVFNENGGHVARIKVAGVNKYIGTFDSVHAASYVYERIKGDLDAKRNRPNVDLDKVYAHARAQAMKSMSQLSEHATGTSAASAKPIKVLHSSRPVVDSLPRGVRKRESGNYEAQIWYGDRKRYIGSFTTKERAGAAFQVVRKALDDASSPKEDEIWFAQLKEDAWKAAQEVSKNPNVTVGARVGIYWDLDRVYYPATVTAIFKNLVTLVYDDGHIDSIDLTKEDFKRLGYEVVPQTTALVTPGEMVTPSKPASISMKQPKPVAKASKKSSSVKKKKYRYEEVTCMHCGRHFGVEGLRYHLANKVCLKGKDTSKRPAPQRK